MGEGDREGEGRERAEEREREREAGKLDSSGDDRERKHGEFPHPVISSEGHQAHSTTCRSPFLTMCQEFLCGQYNAHFFQPPLWIGNHLPALPNDS